MARQSICSSSMASSIWQILSRTAIATRTAPSWTRTFSNSTTRQAQERDDPSQSLLNSLNRTAAPTSSAPSDPSSSLKDLQSLLGDSPRGDRPAPVRKTSFASAFMSDPPPLSPGLSSSMSTMDRLAKVSARLAKGTIAQAQNLPWDSEYIPEKKKETQEPYHFHIYSHRQNTHVTVTKPDGGTIISVSCGMLGFKKAGRKQYDAAYQVGAYAVDWLHQRGWVNKMHKLEVVLRGFGPGRDAVVKVLMGGEGRYLRQKIVRVSDATRIKFGGCRSPKPRRLG